MAVSERDRVQRLSSTWTTEHGPLVVTVTDRPDVAAAVIVKGPSP
jgi:hypothetical protein